MCVFVCACAFQLELNAQVLTMVRVVWLAGGGLGVWLVFLSFHEHFVVKKTVLASNLFQKTLRRSGTNGYRELITESDFTITVVHYFVMGFLPTLVKEAYWLEQQHLHWLGFSQALDADFLTVPVLRSGSNLWRFLTSLCYFICRKILQNFDKPTVTQLQVNQNF